MCPLYPFHMILLYLCLLLPLILAVVEGAEELIQLRPQRVSMVESHSTELTFSCTNCPTDLEEMVLRSSHRSVSSIEGVAGSKLYHQQQSQLDDIQEIVIDISSRKGESNWTMTFNVSANFLGFSEISANLGSKLRTAEASISVMRKPTLASKIFTSSVAILISLAYINMGCAVDLEIVKSNLKRPVGPAIGFIAQYFIMPIISFLLGFLFDSAPMRLGLFVTGASPGGGASNIWTLMYGGNLNLSLTMTAISTFAAFFMMPLWVFTLGAVIFDESEIVIPYSKFMIYATCLIVPLMIGVAISRYAPTLAKFLVKILKPMAFALLLFIVVFGIYANQYIFRIMDWKVWLVGMGLPWFGFTFGCILAKLCRRSYEDIIAISIETGIQNTGVAIFILWFTLDRPLGDIAAVIPVAAAMMTPVPLFLGLIVMKIRDCFDRKNSLSQEYIPGNEKDGIFAVDIIKDKNGGMSVSNTEASMAQLVPSDSP